MTGKRDLPEMPAQPSSWLEEAARRIYAAYQAHDVPNLLNAERLVAYYIEYDDPPAWFSEASCERLVKMVAAKLEEED